MGGLSQNTMCRRPLLLLLLVLDQVVGKAASSCFLSWPAVPPGMLLPRMPCRDSVEEDAELLEDLRKQYLLHTEEQALGGEIGWTAAVCAGPTATRCGAGASPAGRACAGGHSAWCSSSKQRHSRSRCSRAGAGAGCGQEGRVEVPDKAQVAGFIVSLGICGLEWLYRVFYRLSHSGYLIKENTAVGRRQELAHACAVSTGVAAAVAPRWTTLAQCSPALSSCCTPVLSQLHSRPWALLPSPPQSAQPHQASPSCHQPASLTWHALLAVVLAAEAPRPSLPPAACRPDRRRPPALQEAAHNAPAQPQHPTCYPVLSQS